MFVDHVKIKISSGSGGHGYIGFRRAKYVPNGGPDGGDGGRGGDVIFAADTSLVTLVDFRYRRQFKAEDGTNGSGKNCSGKNGKTLTVKVPVGTIIRDAATGRILADLAKPGQETVIAKGGRGGRGNQHFATATRQAPKFAEDGKPGREHELLLELKLIADAGIIGFPNAGKSTLLSMVTNARPKIAGYQFTTLSPNLGVVRHKTGDFVLADIPGLIEGASAGVGLGYDFLRHIERTKVLVHVVDAAADQSGTGRPGADSAETAETDTLAETEAGAKTPESGQPETGQPEAAVTAINRELAAYNPELLRRPQILAANKMDLLPDKAALAGLEALAEREGYPIHYISAATNSGLDALIDTVAELLADYPEDITFEPEEEILSEQDRQDEREAAITIEQDEPGVYRVEGPGIERILGYTNMENEKGFHFFQKFMREKGIIDRLKELGMTEGDTVIMYEHEFEYYD